MRRAALVTLVAICSLTSSPRAQSAPPPTPFRGLIDHVSQTMWGGVPWATSDSGFHALSGDGRYVVFSSTSPDLVPNDYNGMEDVFIRDRMTGTTTRLSVAAGGGESDGLSQSAAISTDGRHVAFASGAANLVAGDTNNHWDVFVRDLEANRTVLVSVSSTGMQGDADSYAPAISADGRYVAFISAATTFAPNTVQYGPTQVYVHDRDTDEDGIFDEPDETMTRFISLGTDGTSPANQYCFRPRVSADGRYVMFESDATNLDPLAGANGQHHLYVRDRVLSQTTLIDRAVTGGPSAWGVGWQLSDMSDDGRFITYASISPDIVPFDMNWRSQVLLYDAAADPASRTTIVSRRTDGTLADDSSYYTTVSADGRYVGFMTLATNLAAPAPTGGNFALVVRDGLDGSFTRVDVVDGDVAFDGQYTFSPSISADGTAIAFSSNAQNAVDGFYTFGAYHIIVTTAFSAAPASAVYQAAGGSGAIEVETTPVSGWKAVSDVDWIALMDGGGFGAGPRTVQYLVSPNTDGIVRNGRIRVGSTFIPVRQEGDGDTTPPAITPIVTGSQTVDGWYISDVTVSWVVDDPESPIVSQSGNCAVTVTIATDALYAPVTCEATSHGGTNAQTVVIRRDTSAPLISISTPQPTIYSPWDYIVPSFACEEGFGYSGVASCTISEGSNPLDTTPGHHTFTVTATDRAFNTTSKTVEYLVGSDACVALPQAPAHLKGWWTFDTTMRDRMTGRDAVPHLDPGEFHTGVARDGWHNRIDTGWSNFLSAGDATALTAGQGLTVAAWVFPEGQHGEAATIVDNPSQYRIARYPDGTLRWAFNTTTGFDWVNTGVLIPWVRWSHVAITYKDGVVQSYVNGRLVHSAQLDGTLASSEPASDVTLAGRSDLTATLFGTLDEVMIFDDALSAADVDSLVLSGGGGVCVPFTSNLALSVPPTIAYGTTFDVAALLTDSAGRPLAQRPLTITSDLAPGSVWNVETNASGSVTVSLPIDAAMTIGDYPNAIAAAFDGDEAFAAVDVHESVTLVGGTPALEWSQPAPVTYGTPLGSAQLNATTDLAGTLVYSPPAGTVLDAGAHSLSVTFTPTDTAHWASRTVTAAIVVDKAVPTVDISSAALFYTGQPRQAQVTVRGVGGAELNPFSVLYNGGTTLPVNAGTYPLQVSYAGSANYEAVAVTGSLVINKATPIMGAFGDITETYDGQPHGISVNVAGVTNEWLTPVVVTYNGSTATPVDAGVYTIEARYDGSANYTAVSRTATLTILKAAPYLTWPNPANITYGTALGATQMNATSNVAGTFTYSPAAGTILGAGTHTLTASFTPADAVNYQPGTASRQLSVSKANAQVTWSAPAPIVYGTPLGATQLNATASVPGTFVYAPPAGAVLNAGTRTLSVTFTPADTANYDGATASRSLSVAAAPLTIRANDASKVFGAPLPSFSATTTGFVNGDSMASLSGSLGLSTPATAASPVGGYAITPSGVSSPNYAVAFAAGTLTIGRASTATSVAASPNPDGLNQAVTFTAAVSVVAPGAGAPGGIVQFFDGGTLLGSATLASGAAALTTNGFSAGSHTISATYAGDASFAASTGTAGLTVKTSAASSTTVVASSVNPSTVGQNVTLTATVTGPSGLSGSVSFYDGATPIGTAALSGTTAQLTIASLAVGGHAITARYSGNSTIPPSTSAALAQHVRLAGAQTRASTTALVASPSPATLGSTVTLSATVTGSQNKAPSGVVLFMLNGFVLGQGTVSQTGATTAVASLAASSLPHGTHKVEAVYLGDATFRASRTSISLVVN